MRWSRAIVVWGAIVAACQFRTNPGTGDGGRDAPIDAFVAPPDGSTCVDQSTSCATADVLRTCPGAGSAYQDTTCAWGCVGSGTAHCGVLVPAGGAVVSGDLDPTGLGPLDLQGTVDGGNGSISGIRGAGSGVIAGIDYHLVNGVAVFRVASLHVIGTTALGGTHPIAFVANGDITIDAAIDVQGACTGGQAGPGGHVGAAHTGNAAGNGGGKGGTGSHDNATGGGGGGHGGTGGKGGNSNSAAAVAFGDAAISTLEGGGGGGGGGGPMGGFGGGGGGALQLVSNGTITLGASGVINAGGCGGQRGDDGGGGGGAGGTILLEGPIVSLNGVLAVNGGGGGAGDSGSTAGSNGQPSRDQAAGGVASPTNSGGDGGSGAAAAIYDGAQGMSALNAGGGAGAVGRIRVNTKSGTASLSGALLSPAFTDPSSPATQAPAAVQ